MTNIFRLYGIYFKLLPPTIAQFSDGSTTVLTQRLLDTAVRIEDIDPNTLNESAKRAYNLALTIFK